MSLSSRRRTGHGGIDTRRAVWGVAALVLLLPAGGAHAQALKTARLAGGETELRGRVLRVTGGYVDPRTGEGRVEHRGRVLRLGTRIRVRRVRTSGLVTRIVASSRRLGTVRLRLRLAQLLFEGGTTTLRLDPGTFAGIDVSGADFGITSGRLDARALAGELGHTGVVTLTRGEQRVELRDIGVRRSALTAQVGDVRPDLATLRLPTPAISGLTATVPPVEARLTEHGAYRLNFYFQTDAFRAGMPFGTVAVRGRLRG